MIADARFIGGKLPHARRVHAQNRSCVMVRKRDFSGIILHSTSQTTAM